MALTSFAGIYPKTIASFQDIIGREMQRLDLVKNQISCPKQPPQTCPKQCDKEKKLKGKTVVVTGGSRGIGLAIAIRCAKDGANIAILAKTVTPQPTLPGTIYTAAEQIIKAGGKALPIPCDIRNQQSVKESIDKVVQTFGGIDILINNASAINLSSTLEQSMKKYDLMHQINIRGTFMVSKYSLPHLLKSPSPHILNLSPPLQVKAHWFGSHLAYTMAKYGMSLCVLGMANEFQGKVAVNALWPKTGIATAAVANILGGDEGMRKSRNTDIMSDAAYVILTSPVTNTGNFYIDEELLRKNGVTDFMQYRYVKDPTIKEEELMPDFFLD